MSELDVSQNEILAGLRKRTQGSYERVKTCEAKAGGRQLPGKLKNAVGQVTRLKLDRSEKTNEPYAYMYASTVEPSEHRGIPCGLIFMLCDDEYRTYDDHLTEFIATLKLVSPTWQSWLEQASEDEFFENVLPAIIKSAEEDKPCFLFNTSNRERKDGTFNVFVQGPPPVGYEPPAREEVNEHADKGYQPAKQSPPKASPPTKASPPKAAAPKAPSPPAPKKAPPAKTPPGRTPPKPARPEHVPDVGGAAMTDFGPEYDVIRGVIQSIDMAAKEVVLSLSNGETYIVPFDNVRPDDGGGTPVIEAGSKVKTVPEYFDDKKSYPGVVVDTDGKIANVDFGNGQPLPIPVESLILE